MANRANYIWLAVIGGLLWAGAAMATGDDAPSPGGQAKPALPTATDARLGGDEHRTRFVMDLTRGVPIAAFTLADPYRVVVDLPQVVFRLPANAGKESRGLIKAYRFGLIMTGASRIVLDATRPIKIDKAFVLDSVDNQPARLVLDLVGVDRQTFMRNLAVDAAARPKPSPAHPSPVAKSADPRPVIVLDPGHGGIDNGTQAKSGETEKSIVLAFALELRAKLEKTGKYRVVMTRDDDTFIPLGQRVKIAREHHAALFISIHADALRHSEGDTRGATVYTLSEKASDNEAEKLAEAENKADLIGGVDLSSETDDIADILIDLAQRETKSFSVFFARTLVSELKTAARLHKHPLKSAGFRVLKAPDVPSVLVELGYMSNQQDLKLLASPAWRSRASDSLVQAVQTFFSMRLAGATPSAVK